MSGLLKSPKAPKPSAQEVAIERRQQVALDKEIEEQEDRLRAATRSRLGTKSLLGGVPRSRAEAAGGRAGGSPARTMLGMGGMGGATRGGAGGGMRSGPYSGTQAQLK